MSTPHQLERIRIFGGELLRERLRGGFRLGEIKSKTDCKADDQGKDNCPEKQPVKSRSIFLPLIRIAHNVHSHTRVFTQSKFLAACTGVRQSVDIWRVPEIRTERQDMARPGKIRQKPNVKSEPQRFVAGFREMLCLGLSLFRFGLRRRHVVRLRMM